MLATLAAHDVDFVVIGGVAVAYHGFIRATKDVDIVPNPSEAELSKLWKALQELEGRPLSLGDLRSEELPVPLSLEGLVQLGNWDIATKYGRLDVLQYVDGVLENPADFKRLRERADPSDHPFGRVWVVGYEDLIDLKNAAGRDQDLIDIRALREARGDTDAR